MKTPTLIIITGPPATGKTTLGRRLAHDLGLPFLHKDGFKEQLFDVLHGETDAHTLPLGAASIALIHYVASVLLAAQHSLIVEANFRPELASGEFLRLAEQYPCRFIQIQCMAQGDVLVERFRERARSGERHAAHPDMRTLEERPQILLAGRLAPLSIGGAMLEVDTTDWTRIDYAEIARKVAALIMS